MQTMAAQLIENVRCDKTELVAMSHSTISIDSCSQLLGLTREQTVARCQSLGWGMQGDFIKPVRAAAVVSHTMSSDQLESLTGTTCFRHRPSPPLCNASCTGVELAYARVFKTTRNLVALLRPGTICVSRICVSRPILAVTGGRF